MLDIATAAATAVVTLFVSDLVTDEAMAVHTPTNPRQLTPMLLLCNMPCDIYKAATAYLLSIIPTQSTSPREHHNTDTHPHHQISISFRTNHDRSRRTT